MIFICVRENEKKRTVKSNRCKCDGVSQRHTKKAFIFGIFRERKKRKIKRKWEGRRDEGGMKVIDTQWEYSAVVEFYKILYEIQIYYIRT